MKFVTKIFSAHKSFEIDPKKFAQMVKLLLYGALLKNGKKRKKSVDKP
jgi:hypothetical protein